MMMRMMIVCLSMALTASPALAQSIGVIDFMAAAEQTIEGKRANEKLEAMFTSRQSELNSMKQTLEQEVIELQNGSMIMSPQALGERQQALGMKQAELQQRAMMAEQELGQMQMELTTDIGEKMRVIAEAIGKEKGLDIVLDKAVAVYVGPKVQDLTSALVTKYNSVHK
ncbi:MAG: Skp family chaperone for outer membrane protein [Myxococcota bacterium]|jgi:Skp family chaperone for outer membrane proteins